MKKALGIISLIVVIIWIIVSISWQSEKIKGIEDNIHQNNIEIGKLMPKNLEIDKLSQFVDKSICNSVDWKTVYWTAFLYNNNWKKMIFTAGHNFLENRNKWLFWCYTDFYWAFRWDDLLKHNDNNDFAWFFYEWDEEWINIPYCKKLELKTQKVWIIWYPSYTTLKNTNNETLTITEWVISWYTSIANWLTQEHLNYFISNNTDTWNSWWPAILEWENWLCLLWILTWAQQWDNISQWIVQNIHNVVE